MTSHFALRTLHLALCTYSEYFIGFLCRLRVGGLRFDGMIEMHLNMRQEKYPLQSDSLFLVFEFTSTGSKGFVRKIILYSPTDIPNYFNLGFGDIDMVSGEISDRSITNNGDSLQVLATVAYTVYVFTSRYSNACIIAKGSTPARTRLYRMGLANQLTEVATDFEVYGRRNNRWHVFRKNVDYSAFMVRRKPIFVSA
jgi:hypothetical protein